MFCCVGLLSCIFPVSFSFAGKTVLVISLVSKGFPYKDHIEELFIVMV